MQVRVSSYQIPFGQVNPSQVGERDAFGRTLGDEGGHVVGQRSELQASLEAGGVSDAS